MKQEAKLPPLPSSLLRRKVFKEEPRPRTIYFQLGVSRLDETPEALSSTFMHPLCPPPIILRGQTPGKGRAEAGPGAAHPAVVFCLLPSIIDDLGKDALAAAKSSLEVDRLFRQCWQGLQTELILVVTQIIVVQN